MAVGGNQKARKLKLPECDDEALALAVPSGSANATKSVLACTALGWLCKFDLRQSAVALKSRLSTSEEATCVQLSRKDDHIIYASVDNKVFVLDDRNLAPPPVELCSASDSINQVVVNEKEEFLATADDSGEIQVVSIKDKKVYKSLKGGHDNICNTVAFRPRHPWQVVSGGLDCAMLLWDFSRGKKLAAFRPEASSEVQTINPPMIYSLAIPQERALSNYIAIGRGDSKIAIYDIKKNIKDSESVLLESSEGHASSIGHLCFANFQDDKYLVSGGNDGKIVLWDWTSAHTGDASLALWVKKHGPKINWTCTSKDSVDNTFIADTSNCISVYSVH